MTDERDYLSTFRKLKTLDSLASLDDGKALHCLGCLIDLAVRYDDPASTEKALRWAADLKSRSLSPSDELELSYFTANAWGDKQNIRNRSFSESWKWDKPEALNQILCLRRALRHRYFNQWDPVRRAQVLTNLGNQFNTLGRFVEAIAHWNDALVAKPNFGMARGNRGLGLSIYSDLLFDPNHKAPFYVAAYRDLEFALSKDANFEGYPDDSAKNAFAEAKSRITSIANINDLERSYNLVEFSLGDSEDERRYRKWALSERLFLNPLNDLGAIPAAAADTFVLPTFTTGLSEPPTWLGLFNQLKQEYVSARWMFYEGSHGDGPHFSDKDVRLYNTLDYPVYGLGSELIRSAFRMAYSLLDKTGFFLNDYCGLQIPETRVYFKTIWFSQKELRPEFRELDNLPWRGLYWLSKDLYDPELRATSEPDAAELYTIRNRLEHSYLKLHEIGSGNRPGDLFHDRMAHSISFEEFRNRTLRALKLARSALIYLALGMHREERRRATQQQEGALAMPMTMDGFDDEWKR